MREILNGRVRVAESIAEGNSDPLVVSGLHPVSVLVIPGDATAKVQYTSTPETLIADAVWRDWEAGAVSENTESVFDGPVTALRLVRTGGTGDAGWEVVAEKRG